MLQIAGPMSQVLMPAFQAVVFVHQAPDRLVKQSHQDKAIVEASPDIVLAYALGVGISRNLGLRTRISSAHSERFLGTENCKRRQCHSLRSTRSTRTRNTVPHCECYRRRESLA